MLWDQFTIKIETDQPLVPLNEDLNPPHPWYACTATSGLSHAQRHVAGTQGGRRERVYCRLYLFYTPVPLVLVSISSLDFEPFVYIVRLVYTTYLRCTIC